MRKIICPTDFSEAANNAMEFAAKLAAHHNVELEIVHLLMVNVSAPMISGMEVKEEMEPAVNTLKKICSEIRVEFGIICNYKIDVTASSLEKAITLIPKEEDLVVIGTNGMDDPYQYVFGTNSYHVIKKANCSVLMVPEGVNYELHPRIVFAWDYNEQITDSLDKLKGIFSSPAEIIFLHVSRKKTEISDDVFRVHKEQVISFSGENASISFEHLYYENKSDLANVIDNYVKNSGSGLLVLNNYDRGTVKNAFHGTIIKELSEVANYCVLALEIKGK